MAVGKPRLRLSFFVPFPKDIIAVVAKGKMLDMCQKAIN